MHVAGKNLGMAEMKEKALGADASEAAQQKGQSGMVSGAVDSIKNSASDEIGAVENTAGDASEAAQQKGQSGMVSGAVDGIKNSASDAIDAVKNTAGDASEAAQQKGQSGMVSGAVDSIKNSVLNKAVSIDVNLAKLALDDYANKPNWAAAFTAVLSGASSLLAFCFATKFLQENGNKFEAYLCLLFGGVGVISALSTWISSCCAADNEAWNKYFRILNCANIFVLLVTAGFTLDIHLSTSGRDEQINQSIINELKELKMSMSEISNNSHACFSLFEEYLQAQKAQNFVNRASIEAELVKSMTEKGEQIVNMASDAMESVKSRAIGESDGSMNEQIFDSGKATGKTEKEEQAKRAAKPVGTRVSTMSQEVQHESHQAPSFLQEKGEQVVIMAPDSIGSVKNSAIGAAETVKSAFGMVCGAVDSIKCSREEHCRRGQSGKVCGAVDSIKCSSSEEHCKKGQEASGMVSGAVDSIKSSASDATGAVKSTAGSAAEAVKNTASGGAETVKNTASGATKTVKNTAGGALESVKNTLGMGESGGSK